MSTMADAFATHEARQQAAVIRETFGHLDPAPGVYKGAMIVSRSTFSSEGVSLINTKFKGETTDCNPWFYDCVQGYLAAQEDKGKLKEGGVYLWRGSYTIFKNGSRRFSGKFERLRIPLSL